MGLAETGDTEPVGVRLAKLIDAIGNCTEWRVVAAATGYWIEDAAGERELYIPVGRNRLPSDARLLAETLVTILRTLWSSENLARLGDDVELAEAFWELPHAKALAVSVRGIVALVRRPRWPGTLRRAIRQVEADLIRADWPYEDD